MGWLERQVFGNRPVQPAPPPPPPPQQNPSYQLPRGMHPAGSALSPAQMGAPASYDPANPYGAWQPAPDPSSATKMAEIIPLWQWQGDPRGGLRDTMELGNCPSCHSPRFFSRVGSDGSGRLTRSDGVRMDPTPECFDCGYPRNQGTLGVSARSTGAAMPARQAESQAPMGSIAHLRRE